MKTGASEPQSSAVYSALRVACCTATLPATVVMGATRTFGERSAMMSATASSEAVSVSMRKTGFTTRRIAGFVRGGRSPSAIESGVAAVSADLVADAANGANQGVVVAVVDFPAQ